MRRFMVVRQMPGIGSADAAELSAVAAQDMTCVRRLAPGIQWVRSFVAENRTYCVYLAEDEETVRRHSELAGFPADKILEIRKMTDPTTAHGGGREQPE